MPTDENVTSVEAIIGYVFDSKVWIRRALQAAGADEDNYDGCRSLSMAGIKLLEMFTTISLCEKGANREWIHNTTKEFMNKHHFARVAKRTGIANFISYNKRTSPDSPAVLRKVVTAIIAAVFIDRWDFMATFAVALRILVDKKTTITSTTSDWSLNHHAESITCFLDSLIAPRLASTIPAQPVTSFPVTTTTSFTPDAQIMQCFNGCQTIDNNHLDDTIWAWPEKGLRSSYPQHGNDQFNPLELVPYSNDQDIYTDSLDPWSFGHSGNNGLDFESILQTEMVDKNQVAEDFDFSTPGSLNIPIDPVTVGNPCSNTGVNQLTGRPKRSRAPESAHGTDTRSRRKRTHDLSDQTGQYPGHSALEDSSLALDIQDKRRISETRFPIALLNALVTAASPQSILALQRVLREARHDTGYRQRPLSELTQKQKFDSIKGCDSQIAAIKLFQAYLILDLYKKNGGSETPSVSGYVHSTPSTLPHRSTRSGNPQNHDDAAIAHAMMGEIFPGMQQGTNEYKIKLKECKTLRNIAKRLYIMEQKFGLGVFGLMLDVRLSASADVFNLDTMFRRPNNEEFNLFVDLLEKLKGQLLRDWSRAVNPAIEAMLQGTLHLSEEYRIEKLDTTMMGEERGYHFVSYAS